MKHLLLLAALACACCGGLVLGRCLARRFAERKKRSGRERLTVSQALEDPVFAFASLAAVGGVASMAIEPRALPICLLASALMAKRVPAHLERKRRQAIRASCEKDLPMLCDIVAMGIDAGLSFDAALKLYCSRFGGELACRMAKAQSQWEHAVATREEALKRVCEDIGSPALKRFADTAVRAVAKGAPLAGMLRRLALSLRHARKTQIEREVAKAPVKMLVPTGVFILPAMLLLVMGPMILQFMGS